MLHRTGKVECCNASHGIHLIWFNVGILLGGLTSKVNSSLRVMALCITIEASRIIVVNGSRELLWSSEGHVDGLPWFDSTGLGLSMV